MVFSKNIFGSMFFLISAVLAQNDMKPTFRILAPQFICPKDKDTQIKKADETVIRVQTPAGADYSVEWTVRWDTQHLPSTDQRTTLLIWRTVRALEKILNKAQKEKYVYVIDNAELLRGVTFVFTTTVRSADGVAAEPKSFQIDNSQGDNKLELEDGTSDMFSVVLLGSQVAYPDLEFVLEAEVTMCMTTEDYHFAWTVRGHSSEHAVDVSQVAGSRLIVPPNSLKPGILYDAKCQIIRASTGEFITETGLPFEVSSRGVEVYLSADHLLISKDASFTIEALVLNHDHFDENLIYDWSCIFDKVPCGFFETKNLNYVHFDGGLPAPGQYEIGVKVAVQDETASTVMKITVKESNLLPVLEVTPISRVVNEGATVALSANASNVTPTCSLTWYFSAKDEPCMDTECEHGEPISDTLTIYSLEETFLSELADFSNDTAWLEIQGEMVGASGRARLVAECGCSQSFSCETEGVVYADVIFTVNESPKPGEVLITPFSGIALESIFRVSTRAVVDPDTPLKYSFYCGMGDDEPLLLAYNFEHLSVETFLPFVDGLTPVWVEVCDAAGACSTGASTLVNIEKGDGRTVTTIGESVAGNMRRCELLLLQKNAASALVTYKNAGLQDALNTFTKSLEEVLGGRDADICSSLDPSGYSTLLQTLTKAGFDTSQYM